MQAPFLLFAAGMNSQLGYIWERATIEAKVIIVFLVIFSMFAWSVMVSKGLQMRRARRLNDLFMTEFRVQKAVLDIHDRRVQVEGCPLFTVYQEGCIETEARLKQPDGSRRKHISLKSMEHIKRTLEGAAQNGGDGGGMSRVEGHRPIGRRDVGGLGEIAAGLRRAEAAEEREPHERDRHRGDGGARRPSEQKERDRRDRQAREPEREGPRRLLSLEDEGDREDRVREEPHPDDPDPADRRVDRLVELGLLVRREQGRRHVDRHARRERHQPERGARRRRLRRVSLPVAAADGARAQGCSPPYCARSHPVRVKLPAAKHQAAPGIGGNLQLSQFIAQSLTVTA